MISGITMRGTGIFCNLLAFLRWVDFAQRMGYIPVIDMQNVENLYLEDELLGRVNAYEYFLQAARGRRRGGRLPRQGAVYRQPARLPV